METCDECGGTKDAVNINTGEEVCDNRSCPESPMRDDLTFVG